MADGTVADADAAADQGTTGGGRALSQPRDSEYGRMAVVADP